MNTSTLTASPHDRKVAAWVLLVVGVLLTIGGIFGVWLQGPFYKNGFPIAATFGEVCLAFIGPAACTSLGSLIVAWFLLASPMTDGWPAKRKLTVFGGFVLLVLVAVCACGYIAACRAAEMLN